MALVVAILTPSLTSAQESASDSSGTRDNALRAIPWRDLDAATRAEVGRVVHDTTIYRQLPTRVVDCDEQMFAFLVTHPELVVESWNVMGVSRLDLRRVGPGEYRVSDSAGAVGEVRVAYRDGGEGKPLRMVIVANGVYQATPMPSPLRGESVLLLRAEPFREPSGRTFMTTRLDTFMRFDGAATRVIAKTVQPLLMRTADHNFVETMRFVSLFSRSAETNPKGMERLAGHLERTDEETRREFVTVCHETSDRYAQWRRDRVRLAMAEETAR